jgi:spore maturation protein CgeB
MKLVFLGLSITSSWGNGHATNYRALVTALRERGHEVVFLERDVPWYASHSDAPDAGELYTSVDELRDRFAEDVRSADLAVVGSYVRDGVEVADWVLSTAGGAVAFYDIDTPVTLAKLAAGDEEYLVPDLVPRFDLYLSFTGGPTLTVLEERWNTRRARPFYCLVDASIYRPLEAERRWQLGYLGTYSRDRQPAVERLLFAPARHLADERFVAAGPQYPPDLRWPANVEHMEHLAPAEHPRFYAAQAVTLNVTRPEMVEAGWSPSVRLFEAAACAVPVISDRWEGLDRFFLPGTEILIADDEQPVVRYLTEIDEEERRRIGQRARRRVLEEHTAERRAAELEAYALELAGAPA